VKDTTSQRGTRGGRAEGTAEEPAVVGVKHATEQNPGSGT